jgi:O-antigen ligase
VVAVVVTALAVPAVTHRLTNAAANVHSNHVHAHTLRQAARDLARHPVFGIGLADFGPQLGEAPLTSGAHSTYLTVGAELGLAGLLALVAAVACTARVLINACRATSGPARQLAIGLAGGYAGFAVAAGFYDLWWDDFNWLVSGVVFGVCALLTARSTAGAWRRPNWVEGTPSL